MLHRHLALLVTLALAACTDASQAGAPAAVDLGAVDSNSAGSDAAGAGEYRVDLHIDDVAGRWLVTVNGFPVWDRSGQAATTVDNRIDPDLTRALVGRGNRLRVEVWPRLRWTPEGPAASATALWGQVLEVRTGDDGSEAAVPVASTAFDLGAERPAWEQELRSRWRRWSASVGGDAAQDSVQSWVEAHPVAAEVEFDNARGPDFSAVFREASVIAGTARDSARLRDYAVHLRDLTVARDTAALWSAFEQKYTDEMARFGDGGDSVATMRRARNQVVKTEIAAFGLPDVELRSWSEGRVWELYRLGAAGLLQGSSGGPYREVYVGEGPDGNLRVVR